MALVAAFGLCHGHAHGTEMPESVNGLVYAAGFMLMTATLHAAGVSIGLLITRITSRYGDVVLRSLGAGVALVGAGLMAGAM
jgi:urease accessory protein